MRDVNLKNKGIIQLSCYTGFYLFAMVLKEVVLGFSVLVLYQNAKILISGKPNLYFSLIQLLFDPLTAKP